MTVLATHTRTGPARARPACALLAGLIGLTLAQTAAEARSLRQEDILEARLLPGWQMPSGNHMAALQLDLAPGWKTYWRAPGDAGIPPRFDWSGSENLKSVTLHWPAPTVFHTNGYQTIGYKGGLVLPVEITARDPALPVRLHAVMELGICKDICLPAFLDLAAEVTPPGAPDPAIRTALQAGPVPGTDAGVRDLACAVEPIADGLAITATLSLPPQPGTETVAFEARETSVWVAESKTSRSGTRLTARTEMVGPSGAPFALDRSGLTLTIIHAGGAIEVRGCPAP